jgi:hypothetical protein
MIRTPASAVIRVALLWALCVAANAESAAPRAGFVPVQPLGAGTTTRGIDTSAALGIHQGQFFSYALPPGWRVGEDGQFALTLVAPDNQAITVMVGNSGFPPGYSPAQFVYQKLMAMQPANLQMSQPRQARPINGFQQAYEFDVGYIARGVPSRGVVKCSINTAYDSMVMVMTAALASASQWPQYAGWLPQVAEQISATNGGAFGMRGLMQQNLRNSTAYGEAARSYRDWSQHNWQQVTDERNASVDRRNEAVRENLGGVNTYNNPYGSQPVQLPQTYQYYWIDRQGNIVGTNDGSVNPNVGSTGDWRAMPQRSP